MEIHLSQILFQILNFAVVFFLLKKFVYKPVLKILDDRANRIKDGLDAAEKNLKLHDQLNQERKQAKTDAKKSAAEIIAQAEKKAETLIKTAEATAKTEAQKVLEKERQAFMAEMKQTEAEFRKNMSALVAQATEAVLKGSLDLKLQNELIDNQIKSLTPKNFD